MPVIRRKWRPPLALVVGCTVFGVLALPAIGLLVLFDLSTIMGWASARALIALVILIATCVIGFVLWRTIMRPVKALSLYAGELPAPLPDHFGTRELADLGRSVIQMRTRLEDRETGLKAYTDHVTHELRSPLSAIHGAAELLASVGSDADRAELVETIQQSTSRIEHLLGDLQRLSRARDPRGSGPSDPQSLADSIEIEGLTLRVEARSPVPLPSETLTAVLEQLAQNAARHGARTLTIKSGENRLSVIDDGPGIGPGDVHRIFEPFFTSSRVDGGTGMGLPIARTLLRANGGDLILVPGADGARFDIILPEKQLVGRSIRGQIKD